MTSSSTTSTSPLPARTPVLIAGGGPVGLTVAALLAQQGIASTVIEADSSFCDGSRAICMSRRSLEILGWIGADKPMLDKGLSWVGGRSYFRDREVLHFEMPAEPTQRFGPMVNIQQYYAEEFAHDAAIATGLVDVRWSTRVSNVTPHGNGNTVEVTSANGSTHRIEADWVIACDGGRSTVRELLGLQLSGMQYDGRYVIVDIEQATSRPVERLAWFDPPSNPGSTILMHRQPDNVWRIDYQIRDDEDPAEAVKPENVLPRVQSHLDMIGETAPWKPLWISIYNAKCLTLPQYRHGRVLFAGDAAHLVPIFGVRGLNSGLDDAGNLAWKLAAVLRGEAADSLLDSYSIERVHAARENIRYGAKSTEFMAPPNYGFRLMREAALRLALENDSVRSLVNPRQTTAIEYVDSPLNIADFGAFDGGPHAGLPAPEASIQTTGGAQHLSELFGQHFVALYFGDIAPATKGSGGVRVYSVRDTVAIRDGDIHDTLGQMRERFAAAPGTLYVIRPDGYVLGRWRNGRDIDIAAIIDKALQQTTRTA
ncbi:MAG TPA: FAD-dependent oxidoreductase [Casimicrobium huifangae]|jgi:3-(3-hydroxy-phenyl)propionate hydroxylase|uniref:FAD-dependent oxidoreductase n=1 Tax=Casimicrobium huifangae TaxID=2591109 RepID=UPI0012EC3CE9|nr:FAD-dependent oxidoreductase [Casimicrobium huifangae]HOB01255.1 FAD-dependent oxidoreductase [Casimicrobium huifangae]HQD64461.1 FAD-dependent oxidoreductase [Casimicrobium huifangae]